MFRGKFLVSEEVLDNTILYPSMSSVTMIQKKSKMVVNLFLKILPGFQPQKFAAKKMLRHKILLPRTSSAEKDRTLGGLIFPLFPFCILCLCLVFCFLLDANMATNVGHPHALLGTLMHCWAPSCTVGCPRGTNVGCCCFLGPKKTICLANESFILFTYLFKSKTHLNFTKIQLIA